jgi:hypothetical protein
MAQEHTERKKLIHEEIIVQSVETLTVKSALVQEIGRELAKKFHILAEVVQGARIA